MTISNATGKLLRRLVLGSNKSWLIVERLIARLRPCVATGEHSALAVGWLGVPSSLPEGPKKWVSCVSP